MIRQLFRLLLHQPRKGASAPELGNDFLELVSQHFLTNHNSTLIFGELTHAGLREDLSCNDRQFIL